MTDQPIAPPQIFHDAEAYRAFRPRWVVGRIAVYGALVLWAVVCLFPIYWTITTSFKMAPNVMQGHVVPWLDYTPSWLGWRSLGLSPDTIGGESTPRAEFFKRFLNSAVVSLSASALVDGLSIWGAFFTIILPIALPGMVAAFILSLVLTWNEYFFAALLTSTNAVTLPVMVASQTGSQGINWWSMAALSFAAILPLIVVGVLLERFIIQGMTSGAVK